MPEVTLFRAAEAPLQARWAKKGKRKKRPKWDDRSAEQKAVNPGPRQDRIFDNIMDPETPFEMKRTISQHMRGLMSDGRHNVRRKKEGPNEGFKGLFGA